MRRRCSSRRCARSCTCRPAQGWVVGENLKTGTFAVEATTNGGRTWTTQYKTS
ncbi:MAG TPA: hypothetical protein VHV09_19480 [Trebonia sp.]|nr:hypothetical protein [Trebonia sp.]